MAFRHRALKVGERFGMLEIVGEPSRELGHVNYPVLCDCGNKRKYTPGKILNGIKTNCGCVYWHGRSRDPMYKLWGGMLARCYNTKNPSYLRYGGRGIEVSEEWKVYDVFLLDMGARPNGAQIDRIDNDGPYCKENCRWVTPKQNTRNKSNSIYLEYLGEMMHAKEISEKSGVNYRTILWRSRNNKNIITGETL